MLGHLLAFSIDWSALLNQETLVPLIFGILIVVLPQYKDQIEKLKAIFGKGTTAAQREQYLTVQLNKLGEENARLVDRVRSNTVMQATAVVNEASDPKAGVNDSLQRLTDHFVMNGNTTGVEAMKTAWSEINKVQPQS